MTVGSDDETTVKHADRAAYAWSVAETAAEHTLAERVEEVREGLKLLADYL